MQQAVHFGPNHGKIVAQFGDLIFVLDIADENGRIADQFLHALAPGFAAHGINHIGAGFLKNLADVPGHAFAIGHAQHQNRFAGIVAESRSRCCFTPRNQHASKFQTRRQLSSAGYFAFEKIRIGQPLAQVDLDFDRVAGPHDVA